MALAFKKYFADGNLKKEENLILVETHSIQRRSICANKECRLTQFFGWLNSFSPLVEVRFWASKEFVSNEPCSTCRTRD